MIDKSRTYNIVMGMKKDELQTLSLELIKLLNGVVDGDIPSDCDSLVQAINYPCKLGIKYKPDGFKL